MLTYHNLDGFDMVYAVTEQTINNQFKLLWALGVLPSSWKASPKRGYSIDAQLGTPSVNFDTGDSSARKVNLVLPLTKGTCDYNTVDFDDDGNPVATPHHVDISGSKLQLTCNLSKAPITKDQYTGAPHIPSEVKEQLKKFDDSLFSIEHLFMNLEDAHLLNNFKFITNGRVDTTDPAVVSQVSSLIQAYIEGLKKPGASPYILGYAVTDKKAEGSDATWKPTDVTFSTYSDKAYPLRTSLNYLLETQNKPLPGGNAGIFRSNWVKQDNVQGTFVFSQGLVLKNVLGAIANALPKVSENSFSANVDNSQFTVTFGNDVGGKTTVTVSPKAGTNTIEIAFHATFNKNAYDWAGSKIGTVDGWINQVSTLAFTVDAKTNDINVSVTHSPQQTHQANHPNDLGKFESWVAENADAIVPSVAVIAPGSLKLFKDITEAPWKNKVSTAMDIMLDPAQQRIILPGGSELFFKNLSFQSDGTMLLTTTIKD
jgi:hypothetical protein